MTVLLENLEALHQSYRNFRGGVKPTHNLFHRGWPWSPPFSAAPGSELQDVTVMDYDVVTDRSSELSVNENVHFVRTIP